MLCDKVNAKLYEFIFDLLEKKEKSQFESHINECAACRKAYEAALRQKDLLKKWAAPHPPAGLADEATAEAIKPRIISYKAVEPAARWLGSRRFWAAAAAILIGIGAAVAIHSTRVYLRKAGFHEVFVYGQSDLTPGLPAAYRVYVRSGLTTKPVAGAPVDFRLVSDTGRTVWKASSRTDEGGIVQVEPDLPEDLDEGDYTLKVTTRSDEGESKISQSVTVKRSFRVMVTTDKPIYQPGQVIHIRALSLAIADLRPVGERDIIIEVQDAKGNKVFKKIAKTSEFGIASADFQLADQVNIGSYTICATIGDTSSERSVTVEHYRLPKFKIDLATDKGFYMPGDTLKGNLSAEYIFGKPVAGSRIHIVASKFIETFHPFCTVEGKTDADGKFHFEMPLEGPFVGQELKKGDAFVTIEATVTDNADHTQKKSIDLTITAEPIRVELFPESGTLVQNVENILYIVTAYPDGRPAKTRLTIGATRQMVETSDAGIAQVKITPAKSDLRLTVQAEDEKGLRATVTRVLRVGERSNSFLLRTDRAVYRAGNTVGLSIISADRKARVFLDVVKDRRTMLMKTIDVRDGEGALALDLPPDLFGTLELHAYRIMWDGNIISDTKVIQVNRPDDLRIAALFDKTTYRPAEKAVLDFVVSGKDGKPVQAALGLAGVDEAVFALQEMQPGLARVYFTLQEEILKPRYEIHARVSITPADTTDVVPTREMEEASVVLFSAAEGSGPPKTAASPTFKEAEEILRREKDSYFNSLTAAGALVPPILFALLALPIIIYAWFRLFHRAPVEGATGDDLRLFQKSIKGLLRWWIAGLCFPFAAAAIVLLSTSWLGFYDEFEYAAIAAAIVALIVLVMLFRAAWRLRRCRLLNALPLLKKMLWGLPFAYGIGGIAVIFVFAAVDSYSRLLREEAALLVFGAMLAVAIVVAGAISIARNCAVSQITVKRWVWLAFSRSLLAALLCFLVAALLLPASLSPLEHAARTRWKGEGLEEAEADDWEVWTALTADKVAGLGPVPAEVPPAAPAEGDALKAPTRIRRYFPETLLWQPELITDASGRAKLELPLADSITTWRIAMSAVSRNGELGAETKPLRVFQDFFIDIDFPVALTQNDLISVPIAVYNYLDKPQTVRLEVQKANWFDLLDEPTRTLKIGPKEVTGVYFRIAARRPGLHTLTVKAFGSEMADAVERKVFVEPDGKAFVETINGRLDKNLVHQIVIPEGAIDGASDLLVKIYPGAFSQVVEGLDSIFQMPFGCFEQTSSVTYPNLLVLDYMRQTGQIKPEIEMKALNYISLGYQRLLSYEVRGGGFEWFGQAPAHIVLTAYGLMEFNDMSKVFDVDPAIIQRTREWLYSKQEGDGSWHPDSQRVILEGAVNQFQGQTLRTTAYVAWALAESGTPDKRLQSALDYVIRGARGTEDAYALAICANALIAAERSEARAILDRLTGLKQEKDGTVWWTSTAQGVTFSRGNCLDIETTALAAYAFLKAGRHTDIAHKALAWLIEQKDSRGTWHSTQATIHAMRALLAGTGNAGSVEGKMNVTITANGKVAQETEITPETSDVFRLISLRPFVKQGQNTVAIEVGGKGNLAYQIVATHYLPWPKELPKAEKEMTIELKYDTTTLSKDDVLTCHTTIRYNRAGSADMTIVDLGIPPGFEVMPDAFEALKKQDVIQRWSMTGRQVILYFRQIPGQKPITFTWQLRAKFPVKAKTPRTVIYKYYEPEVRDESAPVLLTVL